MQRVDLPRTEMLKLAASFAGLQFMFAACIGNASPYLLELGVPKRHIGLVWLAGPIAGIVVQPLVGFYSDTWTGRFGRRRPFIFLGGTLVIIFASLFASARSIGLDAGDTEGHHSIGRVIAICSFWGLDFGLNSMMVSLRALLTDILPRDQQSDGNALFSVMISLGNVAGYGIGALHMSELLPMFHSDIQATFMIGTVLVLCGAIATLSVSEQPYVHEPAYSESERATLLSGKPPSDREPALSFLANLHKQAREFPVLLHRVFLVQALSFFAWFTLMTFGVTWVALTVFGGNSQAQRGSPARDHYDKGVKAGNFALFVFAIVSGTVSLTLPWAIRTFGYLKSWFYPTLLLGAGLGSAVFIHSPTLALVMISCLGPAWATTMTLPWVLTSIVVQESRTPGMHLAMFNIAQCVPQVIASLSSMVLLSTSPSKGSEFEGHGIDVILTAGGVVAFVGAVIMRTIPFEQIHRIEVVREE